MEQSLSQEETTFVEDLDLVNNEDTLPGASWTAPEYHHTEKTKDWFFGLGIITVTIAIISIIVGNWLFAVLIIIGSGTLAMFAHRPPRIIHIHLGTTGIILDKKLYNFEDIECFWVDIVENPAHPKIIFKSKHLFMPFILVPLGNMHPDDVADFIAEFLPEVELKEPLLQRLAEDLGF